MSKEKCISLLEKFLLIPAIILSLTVVVYNARNIFESRQRVVMQNNRQEYNLQALVYPYGEVAIFIDEEKNYPDLQLLINGVVVDSFNKGNRITLQVRDRDLIQINGTMYDEEITVVMEELSKNIITQDSANSTVINRNIQALPTIRIQ